MAGLKKTRRHSNIDSRMKYGSLEQRKMFAGVTLEVVNGFDTIVIDGTSGDDVAEVTRAADGQIRVEFNNEEHFFNTTERIRFLGRSGDDTFTNNTDISSSAVGHDGDDTLRGGNGNNWIQGGQGNDLIVGGDKNDLLRGRAGDDTIEGGKRHDRIFGDGGDDTIVGESGRDFIQGGDDNDTIFTGNGDDRVNGGSGNNKIGLGNHVNGDVVLYDRVFEDYDVEYNATEIVIEDSNRRDTLTGAERFNFENHTLNTNDISLELNEVEEGVLRRLNELRASEGLAPVTVRADLTEFGRQWMTENGLVHSATLDRAHLFIGGRETFGENIGLVRPASPSEDVAQTMHESWRNSPVHFNNMIGSNFDEVGIAAVELADGWYFMQFFMG